MDYNSIVNFGIIFTLLSVIFKLLSCLEKQFINHSRKRGIILEKRTFYFFKFGRWLLITIGALELTNKESFGINLLGVIPFIFGLWLRILSIKTLGEFWSYYIKCFEDHMIVKKGIYRFLKHPAYIGNIYIPAFFYTLRCNVTAIISLIFACSFYLIRCRIENRLLYEIQNKNT